MRHRWKLKYGFKFRGGKKQLYIQRSYQIGFFSCCVDEVTLTIEEAHRLIQLIQENEILNRKAEMKE